MKHINRIVSMLTALLLALALLTGCGDSTQGADGSQSSQASSSVATEEGSESQATPEGSASNVEAEVKHITLTVTYKDEHSDEYTIDTTADFLKEAIEDQVELGGSDGDYGFYIESVNGETADYDADGAYWAIYVNDDYGMYGIDSQPVADGDSYALVYTVG